MKPIYSLFLVLATFQVQASNEVHGHKDDNEVRMVKDNKRMLDRSYQTQLRNQPNWQNFLIDHGTWYVFFNEANAKPHRAFGKPIDVPGTTAVEKAEYFMANMLNGFNVPTDELVYVGSTANQHAQHVFYEQLHNGKAVLNSRVSVRLTIDGRVNGFSLDAYNDFQFESPALSPSEATNFGAADITNTIVSIEANSDWKVLALPLYETKETEFRPVYEMTIYTMDEAGVPANYLTYVDAVTGNVLGRTNLVAHCTSEPPGSVSVNVTDNVSLTQPFDPETNTLLPNLEVAQGGNIFHTDENGNVAGLNLGNTTFRMRGLWSEVFSNGTTPSFSTSLVNGVNAIDWGSNANNRESSAFYHVSVVHDYMKTKFPLFTGLDSPLETNVDVAGTCNAFYDGTSINFYQEGAGCNSFARVADVVYHEYGHAINGRYYLAQNAFFQNGAMNEGYADIWAMGITNNPVLGQGNSQSLPDDFIRRYDIDPKVYPQDIIGEVHADGEIIAGAWWDLAQNFGDLQQMMDLFSSTFDAAITGPNGNEGEIYVEILVEALLIDDAPANGGDNDITNGTPNDLDIINAFDLHGITLLSNASLNHSAIEAHDNTDIDIELTVQNDYPWALSNAIVSYRINNELDWTTIDLTETSSNVYNGAIPAQPNATVIAYYVALENLNGTLANVQPVAANLEEPNLPNYILIGYEQNRIEDFDNFQDSGWEEGLPTDNNTTGTWTIDVPVPSFSDDGVMVQVEEDHTPGSSNIACAITGNASNENAAIGDSDVDGGHTTLVSPIFDLRSYQNPAFSFWRYYTNNPPSGANPGADWWQVLITDNGSDWVYVENTKVSDPSWRRVAFRVADYVDLTDNVRIKFIASDSIRLGQNLDGGSLVEGAMDDLELWQLQGTNPEGITELNLSNIITYPNPSNGDLTVSMLVKEPTNLEMEAYNNLGQMVWSDSYGKIPSGKQTFNISLGSVSIGIYQLRMITESGQVVKRTEVLR